VSRPLSNPTGHRVTVPMHGSAKRRIFTAKGKDVHDGQLHKTAHAQAALQPDTEVAIVGAGFGGLGAAIALRRIGIDAITILERMDDVGGTWHANSYPGIAVDIASVTYSFSFEQNPHWSRKFAPGQELAAYARHVAEKYDLRRHMRFGQSVEQVAYDETRKLWTITIAGQRPLTARVLVLATGYLSRPKLPDIPGVESFAGKVIHTAAWDHDYALAGKRVAVIGTGATSVQLVPELANVAGALDVYQRTPIWVARKPDRTVPRWLQTVYAKLPFVQRLRRFFNASLNDLSYVAAVLNNKRFPLLTKLAEQACRMHLRDSIPDPELRAKLTPRYAFGCKRPTFSNEYYPAFLRPHVQLITDPIARIEADGIVTARGEKREIDALVLATGFKVWERDSFHSILGKGGLELRDHWEATQYASYEGLTIPGFPNLFYLPSPYSYTGLSFFFTLEGQMEHIARCMRAMRARAADSFEVTAEAQDAYVADMVERGQQSVFMRPSCAGSYSYYFDRHGQPSLVRPMSAAEGWLRHRFVPLRDYRFD
jgi:cation diffusion facilitator CzcD-associated flavoprotein CzcO